MKIDIVLEDLPGGKIPRTTAQQKRYNRKTGVYFDSDAIAAARFYYEQRFIRARVKANMSAPIETPVRLGVYMGYKAKRKKDIGQPKTTRPDNDNIVKLIQDCLMSAGIIKDDSIIYDLRVLKKWTATEYIYINIMA